MTDLASAALLGVAIAPWFGSCQGEHDEYRELGAAGPELAGRISGPEGNWSGYYCAECLASRVRVAALEQDQEGHAGMTTEYPAVRDALTGTAITAQRHHRHIVVTYGPAEVWLTPGSAMLLAEKLTRAAREADAERPA